MADAVQIRKVCAIIRADEARKIIVVSAAGKRSKDDHKITDLLYLCYAHIKYGVSCKEVFEQVKQRYLDIRDELGLNTPLEAEFDALWECMQHGIGDDELVSRGEYFSARLLADGNPGLLRHCPRRTHTHAYARRQRRYGRAGGGGA